MSLKRPASAVSEPPAWPVLGLEPYSLHLRPCARTQQAPGGRFCGIEFDIRRKSQGKPRRSRPLWGTPLSLATEPDADGRVDLHVRLFSDGEQAHTLYHRVVGFTLLQCWWDDQGRLLEQGYVVPPADWAAHHVHHRSGSPWDVSLRNLAVLTIPCHLLVSKGLKLPRPPCGWGRSVA